MELCRHLKNPGTSYLSNVAQIPLTVTGEFIHAYSGTSGHNAQISGPS
jgi:hypothetical protein